MISSHESEKVKLRISCRSLRKRDESAEPTPECYVYLESITPVFWYLFESMEYIENNSNPDFPDDCILPYNLTYNQRIMFEVQDRYSYEKRVKFGSVETTLETIMRTKNQTLVVDLYSEKKVDHCSTVKELSGKLIIRAEQGDEDVNRIMWQWSGIKLMNTSGWFSKSNPFLKFLKMNSEEKFVEAHKTYFIKHDLNPVWDPFQIGDAKLCSNHTQNFRIECWDFKKNGKHHFIGGCETSLDLIKSGARDFELHNPKKGSHTGTLHLKEFHMEPILRFVGYLRGGMQLKFAIAIDYTASNGHPDEHGSLHSLTDQPSNEYDSTLSLVVPFMLKYAPNESVSLYGFGGCPNKGQTSHFFPLNGDSQSPQVQGISAILATYKKTLSEVEQSNPKLLTPLIQEICKLYEEVREAKGDEYLILTILVNGEIDDKQETADALAYASGLPLSIVIIGVGQHTFYNTKGQYAGELKTPRSLVHFEAFRKYSSKRNDLVHSAYDEVSGQLIEYMKSIHKMPSPPQKFDMSQL